jgi:DNA-binding NtrC family response regulator
MSGKPNRQTILIVDDEAIVQNFMRIIFHAMGYRVIIAINGRQAGELFTRHAPELAMIIVEIALPKASGATFVEGLPSLAPRIPVLFTTSVGRYEGPDVAMRRFPVLKKPFRADALRGAVKTLFEQM